jgi:hypothetical protein
VTGQIYISLSATGDGNVDVFVEDMIGDGRETQGIGIEMYLSLVLKIMMGQVKMHSNDVHMCH